MSGSREGSQQCKFNANNRLWTLLGTKGTGLTIRWFNNSSTPQPVPQTLQPLTSVALGTTATVAEIKLPPESRPRLMEMGLLVGTPVELVRFAPLGDPVEIKVRGYNLTLRKHEAEQIFVRAES